jgi:hypothetical protein
MVVPPTEPARQRQQVIGLKRHLPGDQLIDVDSVSVGPALVQGKFGLVITVKTVAV